MNRTIARALLDDAFHQVLDNRIFRILFGVVVGLIAPAFLIGFREHDVRVLWGWQQISYEDFFRWFGMSAKTFKDCQGVAIQRYQSVVIEGLCGTVGMILCVSATAFFVPRMLEKGSADVLFSKPLSRATLLLARYLSGLLFVGILACALVLGMYLGFLLVSGYGDAGVLWGALTLVYLFAIVHGVSILAGVMTRSTVASTLTALVFFIGSGCVHQGWRIKSYFHESEENKKLRQDIEASQDAETELPSILDEEPGTFIRIVAGTIDTLHYALPKTSDADMITRKLRKTIERHAASVVDETIHLTIPAPPTGFDLREEGLPAASGGKILVDLAGGPAVWSCADPGGVESSRIEISRRSRLVERPVAPGNAAKPRPRKLAVGEVADELLGRARAEGGLVSEPSSKKGKVDGSYAVFLSWDVKTGAGTRSRQAVVFASGDWIVEVSSRADAGWLTPEERTARFEDFVGGFKLAREYEDPAQWFERRLGWTSPLPYNLFFSIGSSVAFTLLALALAVWKLSRIDF
jgi:hypothetical protein